MLALRPSSAGIERVLSSMLFVHYDILNKLNPAKVCKFERLTNKLKASKIFVKINCVFHFG